MSAPEQPGTPVRKWSWRKKLLVWGGGFGAIVAVIALVVLGLTRPLVHIADSFFDDLRTGAVEQAYERASNDFKRAAGLEDFRSLVAKYGLAAVETTSWSNRSIQGFGDGSIGEIRGSATDRDGTVRPVALTFVKEGGVWRVQGLSIKPAGITSFGQTMAIPDERDLVRMTHEFVVVFSRSLKEKSLKGFHEAISERWRRKHSVEDLEAAFKPFLDAAIDLSVVETMTPIFDGEPSVDENGLLIVSGHYPTTPDRLEFKQTFIPEGLGWKLGGLALNIKPPQGN